MIAVVVLGACGGGDDAPPLDAHTFCTYMGERYELEETWAAGDGCNSCHCSEGIGVECTLQDCAASCLAGPGCDDGPECGDVCCAAGERCVDAVCRCGDGDACGEGDTCEAAGPIGTDGCGSVCCGVSGPCPQ